MSAIVVQNLAGRLRHHDDDVVDDDGDDDDDDDDDDNREEDMEEGEARLEIIHGNKLASVTLEALLIGHEERVTSVSWHPNPEPVYGQDLILISSSMDRTIFIWSEHESGVWTPISRVGSGYTLVLHRHRRTASQPSNMLLSKAWHRSFRGLANTLRVSNFPIL